MFVFFENRRFCSFEEFDEVMNLVALHLELREAPFLDHGDLLVVMEDLAESSDDVQEFAAILLRERWNTIPAQRKLAFLARVNQEEVVKALAKAVR